MKSKKGLKTSEKTFFDSKEKLIGACIAGAVVLVLIFVLMLIETGGNKLVVKNSTDLKLEYLKSKFVIEAQDADITSYISTKSIAAGKSYTMATPDAKLDGTEATSHIVFKFENHDEMNIDSGYFNDEFDGSTYITFKKTDDPNILKMTVKAKNGILPSNRIKCNDVFTVDLKSGKVYDE